MGRRGPHPEPAPLKVLKGRGNNKDAAGREIPRVPSFDRCAPEPPAWLDDVAREEWVHVAPSLDRLGLLKDEDRAALAAYCTAWSRLAAAVQTYQREGLTRAGSAGNVVMNPAVRIAEQTSATLLRYAQQFGLTPAAEIALAKPVTKSDDEDDDAYTAHADAS